MVHHETTPNVEMIIVGSRTGAHFLGFTVASVQKRRDDRQQKAFRRLRERRSCYACHRPLAEAASRLWIY